MSKPAARDRLARAAFDLFDERGYEQTTIDDIAEQAGLGRATFFRHYRSKEDVIFPDHDRLLAQIRERLATSFHDTPLAAVSDAVRLVLLRYLEEGELARRRYALTSTVPALRDREIASVARYQRLFREFIAGQAPPRASSPQLSSPQASPPQASSPQASPPQTSSPQTSSPQTSSSRASSLLAELMAAAVVAAHNHVLRRWLRGESPEPVPELDEALRQVAELFTAPGNGTTVVAFQTGQDLDSLLPALRRLVENSPQ